MGDYAEERTCERPAREAAVSYGALSLGKSVTHTRNYLISNLNSRYV